MEVKCIGFRCLSSRGSCYPLRDDLELSLQQWLLEGWGWGGSAFPREVSQSEGVTISPSSPLPNSDNMASGKVGNCIKKSLPCNSDQTQHFVFLSQNNCSERSLKRNKTLFL